MLFDLFVLLRLVPQLVVNDNPPADATARYYFQTDRPARHTGLENEKTAPEMSVPRGPPLCCPSTGPQEIVRMYVGTLPVVAFLLRRAASESSAALLRRSVLREFLFRFPLSGVDAARAGQHGSLAHGGMGGERAGGLIEPPRSPMSGVTSRRQLVN